MKNILKVAAVAAAVLVLGSQVAVQAQSETNVSHSITSTVDNTLGAQAWRERDANRPDWSTYPNANNRQGIIYRNYDYVLDGIPGVTGVQFVCYSNTAIDIKGRRGQRIQSNDVIYGYTLDVIQGSGGGTQAFSLGVNAIGDILALTTNFSGVGRWSARVNPPIKATNDVFLLLSTTATTATSLEFNVFLDALYAP